MNIADKKTYSNYVFEAVVVNTDTNMDPENKNRIQIYIPSMQMEYADAFVEYAKLDNDAKQNSDHKTKFPWATTLVEGLEVGNNVVGCNLNNNNSEYVIMGKNVNDDKDENFGDSSYDFLGLSGDASGLLDLAMPIILQNEVGISTNAWPDKIPDANYTLITPYDNGGWSIGLIQWHHGRAFNLMYAIAKEDSNWKSKSPNKNLDIVKDIASSLKNNSTYGYASKYTSNYHPTSGTDPYRFIKNMLGSNVGKKVQRDKAKEDTGNAIELVMGTKYGVSNPAIIIWLVDIMNQYGNGLPTTIKKAAEISKKGGDMIKQLDEFKSWCSGNLGSYSKYKSRRDRTYNYVKNLYNSGKLTSLGTSLTSVGNNSLLVQGFVKRTTKPSKTDYWFRDGIGNAGYSMWSNGGNCTFYAWGRASEILGRKYDGATGNGSDYGNQDGKYKTGSKPRQGAIITWSKAGAPGHVAIVEDVSADGNTIWTSESGWQSFLFKYKERKNDGNWGAGSAYKFKNFKYII